MKRGGIAKEGMNRVARCSLLALVLVAIAVVSLTAAAVSPRITSPSNGATVSGVVGVNVRHDSGFWGTVRLQYAPSPCTSWTQIGASKGGGNFTITRDWNTTTLADGSYCLRVTINGGQTHKITVTVANVPPNNPPVAQCQDVTTSADSNCQANVTAQEVNNGSYDPDGDPITLSLSPSGPYLLGTTPVTLTVTDSHGASDTCTATVTVEDKEAPVISGCPTNITQPNDAGVCSAVATWTPPTANDNCDGALTPTGSHAPGATFPVGTTTVTYNVSDTAGNAATQCSFTVTVEDKEAPVISGCPTNITQPNDAGVCSAVVTWTPPTANDNCDGALTPTGSHTPGATFPVGTTTVTYNVSDAAGNAATTCSFTVTVNDVEPPTTVFEVTPPNPDNDPTPYFEWTGTDNCTVPANLVYRTKLDTAAWSGWSAAGADSTTLGPLAEGPHTFQVQAKDEAGNIETTATYTWVIDLTGPEITIYVPEDRGEYGLNATVPSDWVVVDPLAGLDNASASDDANTGMASGEAFYTGTVGLHPFTVTATDFAGTGNTATETVEYRVVETVIPGGTAGGGGALGEEGASGFLDKSIAGGGGAVGIATLEAIYTVGEIIYVSFSLTDANDVNVPDAVVSCTVVRVTISEDGEETYEIVALYQFFYDGDLELYTLDIETEGLSPGIYDLLLGFDDGTQERLRIQLEEAA